MSLNRLLSYFSGYVLITVSGNSIEKFINFTTQRGIYLWDIKFVSPELIYAKVPLSSFTFLRHVARQTDCRVRIKKKRGIPFLWWRARKRKVLLGGALFFFVVLYTLSSFIWIVDVSSYEDLQYVTEEEVKRQAAFAGLRPFVLKSTVNLDEIEKQVSQAIPEIAWVGIEIKGTRAKIEIVEKVLLTEEQQDQKPAHVIAQKDAVIKEILVLTGQAKVREGDTVQKGQVLISGIVTPPEPKEGKITPPAKTRYVRAKGIIRARVWYEAGGKAPLFLEEYRKTGNVIRSVSLKIAGKTIILKGFRNIPYAEYRQVEHIKRLYGWRNLNMPVEIVITTYHEVEKTIRTLDLVEAKRLAASRAFQSIQQQLPSVHKLVDRQVQVIKADERTVHVRVLVETLEDIGTVQPFQPSPGDTNLDASG